MNRIHLALTVVGKCERLYIAVFRILVNHTAVGLIRASNSFVSCELFCFRSGSSLRVCDVQVCRSRLSAHRWRDMSKKVKAWDAMFAPGQKVQSFYHFPTNRDDNETTKPRMLTPWPRSFEVSNHQAFRKKNHRYYCTSTSRKRENHQASLKFNGTSSFVPSKRIFALAAASNCRYSCLSLE